jgi:N-acetylglucosaminylphosphatidylinositol deacetylase
MGRRLFIGVLIYGIVSSILYRQLVVNDHARAPPKGDLLLLTAHPDDETMFFGPLLIRRLQLIADLPKTTKPMPQVYVLCVTGGDHGGNATQRRSELINAARVLGLSVRNVQLVSDARWRDGQSWDLQQLALHVYEYIEVKRNIKEIVTFDDDGVSGHVNHRALHRLALQLRDRLPTVEFRTLKSVNLIQKYCAFMDVWWMYWLSQSADLQVHAVALKEYFKLLSALYEHRSQMVWFRQLYSVFSKYMYLNILQPL